MAVVAIATRVVPRRSLPLFLIYSDLGSGFRIQTRSFWSSSVESEPISDASSSSSNSSSSSKQKKLGHRLTSAIDAVNDRKLPPELRGRANAVRSETDIANVVEQRIWQSMEQGHFENLPGKGKPLDLKSNPHADPAEDTLYRILSRNGCAPEWVELNKEIRTLVASWRSALIRASEKGLDEEKDVLLARMKDINNKVLRYNLIVPFGRQMFGLKWEKEIAKLEQNSPQ